MEKKEKEEEKKMKKEVKVHVETLATALICPTLRTLALRVPPEHLS